METLHDLGMYKMHEDPSFPTVTVGDFTICRQDGKSVWIERGNGEGSQFSDALFEAAIREFYNKHF